MNRWVMWGTAAALTALVGCSKQPDAPGATAVVVPASAPLPRVPTAPASDPSLPSAAVVASQPASTAGPEKPTGSPNPASAPDSAASGAADAASAGAMSPPASAASRP